MNPFTVEAAYTLPLFFAHSVTPVAAAPPPVNCTLYNSIATAASGPVGNLLGLQNFAPWIIGILVVVLLLVAFVPRLRSLVMGNIFWLLGVILLAAVIGGLVTVFFVPTC